MNTFPIDPMFNEFRKKKQPTAKEAFIKEILEDPAKLAQVKLVFSMLQGSERFPFAMRDDVFMSKNYDFLKHRRELDWLSGYINSEFRKNLQFEIKKVGRETYRAKITYLDSGELIKEWSFKDTAKPELNELFTINRYYFLNQKNELGILFTNTEIKRKAYNYLWHVKQGYNV